MNILVINHYVGGGDLGMEYRPWYLAREWVRQGHKVWMVGATFSHLRLKNPAVGSDFSVEEREGISYVWIKTPSYGGTVRRILNIGTFVGKLWSNVGRIVGLTRPDVVIASSTYPLDNYPACRIARRAGAKYVYEVHDLWPLSPMLIGGYSARHPFIRVMQKAEDYAYRHVDQVVSLLWNAEEHMREHGLPEGRFACIPNGYDPAEWVEERRSTPLPEAHRQAFEKAKGKIVVGFAGGFAASGALMTLLEAALLLKDDDRLRFVLVGKGPERENYVRFIGEHGLQNVVLLPPVDKVCIPALEQRFDIAFMGGVHSKLHFYGTSFNKMIDYMLAGVPIVQSIDEPGSVVGRTGCGLQVEAENPVAVASAVGEIASMSAEERRSMGLRGRQYAENFLKWEDLARQMIEILG